MGRIGEEPGPGPGGTGVRLPHGASFDAPLPSMDHLSTFQQGMPTLHIKGKDNKHTVLLHNYTHTYAETCTVKDCPLALNFHNLENLNPSLQ